MQEEALIAVLEAADEGVLVFDRDGRCCAVGRRVGELFGTEPSSLVGHPRAQVIQLMSHACEEPDILRDLASAAGGPAQQVVELELHRPSPRVVRVTTSPILGASGTLGWIAVIRDLTRERSAERRAQQLLTRLEQVTATDALTQLPNRRRFLEELEREHGRAARAWDSYAVLRVDVDNMGQLNAQLGQSRGDEVLEELARRLRAGRREYDLIARFLDDELIVLLPGADAHAAEVVAERMSSAVSREPFELDAPRTVTVCIGAAVWVPPSAESGPDVIERAGVSLVRARVRGVGRLEIDVPPTRSVAPPATSSGQ